MKAYIWLIILTPVSNFTIPKKRYPCDHNQKKIKEIHCVEIQLKNNHQITMVIKNDRALR